MTMTHTTALDILAHIRRWTECESPSQSLEALNGMASLIVADARALGLQAELRDIGTEAGPLIHIHNRAPGDSRAGIMVLAHYDTVHPVGTLQQNPCRIEGDHFYGPGTYDMKAGTWLALSALGTVAQAGSSALPIDMVIVPDEETGSTASRPHIEDFARRARYALVCEPARADGGRCVTARKGTGFIWVTTHGRPAHAGVQHDKGRNAIKEMAHQILALEAMTDYARGITVSVGMISGGTTSNVVPEHCQVEVDFRVPDAAGATWLKAQVEALRPVDPDVALKVEFKLNRPPMDRTEATAALLRRAQDSARAAGFELEEAPPTGGGSDANFTAALGVPTLDGLGADGDGAHTLHEHILVSTLPARQAFWNHLLQHLD
ncbi:M20 family metallopeptidase [Corticimicrobacter populi]